MGTTQRAFGHLDERFFDDMATHHFLMGLENFVRQSNAIENIKREPTPQELTAHRALLKRPSITIGNLKTFIKVVQPHPSYAPERDTVLRDSPSIPGVRVAGYEAPASGPEIELGLKTILKLASKSEWSPWDVHVQFESLHPFTDGNGRAGRAVWLWQMQKIGEIEKAFHYNFLRLFYYQTLNAYHG